ncbi:MAG: serine hydrolase domain-containing protein [Crocinitomicaceae bacterium]
MKNRLNKIVLSAIVIGVIACKKDTYYAVADINCTIKSGNHVMHDKYQSILDEYTNKGVVGLSVVISKPDEDLWQSASGYSNIEDNQKMNPCHLQQTASLAKSFTGVIILQLIEEGKLGFDTKINTLLSDEVKSYIPNVDQITIKHLLQQTSGIPDVFSVSFFEKVMNNPEKTYTTPQLLSILKNKKSLQTPGEKHVYSDPNFMLLSLIIDRLDGDHITSYENRIFQPLGLEMYYHNDGFPSPKGLVASYWDQYNNGKYENISALEIRVNHYIKGSGGVISSPAEMVRFYESVFTGGLINEEMLTLIKTDWVKEEAEGRMNTGYSHGFMVVETDQGDWIGHTGLFLGSSCYVYHNIQNQTTIGVFTNTGTFSFLEKQALIYYDLWNDLRSAVE